MNLMGMVKRDIEQITSNKKEWATDIIFTTPDGHTTATIPGIGIKNHLTYDPNTGNPVSTKQARISIAEGVLTAAHYPVRNAKNEVSLVNHLVTWTDIASITWIYKVSVNFPGETTGSIVCILQDYKAS